MRKSKEEINLLSVSFLDLMFGALGALIFLFIIVPKVTLDDLKTLESVKNMDIELKSLDSIMVRIKNSVPEKDYNELAAKSASLQAGLKSLNVEISQLQTTLRKRNDQYKTIAQDLDVARQENLQLKTRLKSQSDQTETIAKLNTKLNEVTMRSEKMEKQITLAPISQQPKTESSLTTPAEALTTAQTTPVNNTEVKTQSTDSAPESTLGFNVPFIVMIEWKNKEDKVHLYMRPKGSSNWCFYQTKRQRSSFGTWDKSLKKITASPFESIIQKDAIVPGEYEIYAQPDKAKEGKVEVGGFIAMKAPDKAVKRINIQSRTINNAKAPFSGGETETYIGTISVTADDFQFRSK